MNLISDHPGVVSITDEAFAILLIENYFDKWKIDSYEDSSKTVYTNPYAGNKLYAGWTKEGIDRYYELCHQIAKERKDTSNKAIEKIFRERMRIKYLINENEETCVATNKEIEESVDVYDDFDEK